MARAPILTGLIGAGIQKSRSPRFHQTEAAALGLTLIYRLIDLEVLNLDARRLDDLIQAAQWMGFSGLNITHPCKQEVITHLDELSPEAATIGAVNTVVLKDGRRVGHNTDAWAFAQSFCHEMVDAPLTHVVQIGVGGGGSATALALLSMGVKHLGLFNRHPARAEALAERLAPQFPGAHIVVVEDLKAALAHADGVVQATPVGMAPYPGLPFDTEWLNPNSWVVDIVYVPLETEFLRQARAIGCRTLHGGGSMAVFQAARAFELFTGVTPDIDRMLAAFGD